jgi:signal transduction histidine kinase/CheY-like chemotaxis protein/PAS domain-containing protein
MTSETRYRDLFENSPISLWEEDFSQVKAYLDQLSFEGGVNLEDYLAHHPEVVMQCVKLVRVLDVNDTTLALHRARDKSDLLESLDRTFTEQALTAFQRELIAIWNGETHVQMDTVVNTLDGDSVDVSVNWSVSPDSERTYDRVIVSLVDISEQKRMEEQLRESHAVLERRVQERTQELFETNARLQREIAKRQAVNENLRQREEELRSLLDNSPDMILKTDPQLRVIWANRTAMEMNPHCVGIPCYQAFPGRDKICEGCPVVKAIETKRLERGVMYQPVSDTAPDEQYWENIGVPQFDESGEIIGCIEISRNITDRMQITRKLEAANKTLKETKEAAEAANLAKSTFLANMSHELRTPLNAVLGFAQLMQSSREATPEQRANLEIITRSGTHLLNLINNVLDISKIESGRIELEKSPHDLHQMIQEIKSLMYVRAQEKGLDFTVEQSRDLPRQVAVDGGKLRQVLFNLIGNGIKFTKQGKVTLRAMMMRQETGGKTVVRFEVKDTGPGISPEDQEHIFAPFVQLGEKSPTEAGSGLGLAISRQYVTLMGGTIGVAGELGKGSVFYFEIPLTMLSPEAMPDGPLRRDRVIGVAEGQPRYRLLIVEDQPENRLLLHELLAPLGFDLREAANGREAVELFAAWHPHLIWMDIRMPVMDGLEATRRIKADADGAQTRIVAITAHALEEERREILAAGCDDFIRKPYYYVDILDALTRNLGVQFVYEEEAAPAVAAQVNTDALACLPDELLNRLARALVLIDIGSVSQIIEEIRTAHPPLAEALAAIAKELQFGRMLRMIRAALGKIAPEDNKRCSQQ